MWLLPSPVRISTRQLFFIQILSSMSILIPITSSTEVQRARHNITQVANVGKNPVVFNHIYSINIPNEVSCDCPLIVEQLGNPLSPGGDSEAGVKIQPNTTEIKGRLQYFKPPGYVSPSAEDLDSNGKPYAEGFQFQHDINVPERSCPCTTTDLKLLQEENQNLHQLMRELETKLIRRIKAVAAKVQRVQSSKCPRNCSPTIDVIDAVGLAGRATNRPRDHHNSCPRDCSEHGRCIDGLCQCHRGYGGEDCAKADCPNACSGHGSCNKHGRCQCWGQWSGEDCSTRSCPNECNGKGICDNGNCICDITYSGSDCGRRSCVNDCNGHGRCEEESGRCRCNGNWEGDDCSVRRCPRDCSGHGECINGRCRCDEQWAGKACRVLRCLNGCSSNGKCRNGTCECSQEWTGPDCSAPQCPSGCSGLGQCKNGACECFEGWGGLDCGQPICPDDCSSNGQCVDGRCRCWGGWDGISCSEVVQPSGLQISNIQPTTIDVSWTKASSAVTANQVNCIPMEGTANAVYQTVGPNVTKLTIRDLDSGTQYSVFVYAMIGEALSAPITASVKTGVDTPSQLNYLRIGDTFAEITWTPPQAKVDRYKMVCSCKQGGAEFGVLANKTSVLIKDLSPGETYTVALYAVQGENTSAPIHINFTTSLDAPASVEFVDVTSSSATVRWAASVAKITGYQFSLVEFGGLEIVQDQVAANRHSFTFTQLKSRTRYNFTIYSVRDGTRSLPFNANLITGLEPPINFTLVKVLSTKIEFNWESPNTRIKRFRIALYPEILYGEGVAPLSSFDLPYQVYGGSFDGLFPGSKYVVEVMSVERGVESGPLVKRVMTGIDKPTHLRVQVVTPTSVIVTWNATQANVEGYSLECIDVRRKHVEEIKASSDELSTEFTNLRPATEYNITVQAELEGKSSSKLWKLTFTTLPPPAHVKVSSPTFDDLVVIWQPVYVFEERRIMGFYDIKIQPISPHTPELNGRVLEFTIPGDNTALSVPGMTAGLSYNITIVAKTKRNFLPPSPAVRVSYVSPVDPPQGATLTHVGHSNVTLRWFPPSAPITGYKVEYQDLYHNTRRQSFRIPPNETYVSINGLTDDTSYVINITSLMHGRSSVASTVMFTTEMMIIEPPEYLHTTEITYNRIALEWMESLSDKIDGYYVTYIPLNVDGAHENITHVGDTTSTVLEGLEPGTEYLISVFTIYNERGSIPVQLSIKTAIDPPTRLMFVTVSDSAFTIHWQKPVAMVTNYIVTYYRSSAGTERQDLIIPGGETVCSIHNLVPATEYTVEIYAMGNSSQSDQVAAMVVTLPASVSQLRSLKQGINHVIVSWEKPVIGGEITGYKLDYHSSDNLFNVRTLHLGVNETQCTVRGLDPATVYAITVYSKRHLDLGEGRTINQGTLIPSVRGVNAMPIDESTISVHWKSPLNVDVDSYSVQYRPLDEFSESKEVVVNGDTTSTVMTGLLADTQYAVTVSAMLGELQAKTRHIKATTASSLESPDLLRITDIRDTSAHVNWDPVIDKTVTGYSLRYKPVGGSTEDEHEVPVKGRKNTSYMLMALRPGILYYVSLATERHERVSFPPVTERFVTSQPLTAPPVVEVQEVSETWVTLGWASQAIDSVEEYHVTYSLLNGTNGETSEIIPASPEFVTARIEGLLSGRSYIIQIRSFRWGQDSPDATSVTVTTLFPLLPPRKLILDRKNQTGARITWTPNTPDADGHNITLSRVRQSRMQFSIRLSSKSRVVAFNDLLPGTRYRVTVATMRGNTTSKPQVLKFKTDEKLAPPTNISISLIGETGANISWIVPSQKFDRIYFSYTSDDETETDSTTYVGKHSGHLVLSQLTPDTLYHAQVAAKFRRKTSLFNNFSFKTDYIIPSPTQIRFTSVNKTRLTTRWHKASERAQYYRIAYQDEDATQRTVTISSRSTQLPLEHLKAGTTYNISVTALGRSKESFPLVGSVTTLLNPPSNLNVTTKSSKSVELTWKSLLNDVDGYVIKYHELESRSRRPNMIMRRNMKVIHMQSNTTVNVTGLLSGKKYVFQVVARKDGRESYSMRKIVETEIAPPQHVKTSVVSRRSANLTWGFADMAGVTGYLINITAINSTFYREYKVSATKRFVFLQNLFPGHEYDVDVATLRKLQKSSSVQVHFKTAKVPYPQPKDCVQVSLNGEKSDDVYEIFPYNGIKLKVFCDLTTHGGGWIVFQRRRDGSVSFDRSWEEYTTGFGNLTSEFWIGLQTLHELTTAMDAPQSLRIDLHHGDDKSYAAYHNFSISNSDDRFVLSASNYSGTAGDSLSYHYGMKFTTYDSDNDEATNRNCAKEYKGAWWFKNCHRSSLNGQYGNSRHSQGVNWYTWGGFTRSIDFVEMKIRPRSFQLPTVRPAIVRRFETIIS